MNSASDIIFREKPTFNEKPVSVRTQLRAVRNLFYLRRGKDLDMDKKEAYTPSN